FDGSHLYEHPDPRKGWHPDWKSLIFNYGRNEVRAFLISNALFWLDQYHIDGLRVDAVASMLYLDYSREDGEWEPNQFGGRENLDAISFLEELNKTVYKNYPDVQTIAEESTSYTGVSKPVFLGGLGFGMKWMMGWMHDTLEYFKKEPVHRKYHQNDITFSLTYAFSENFMLPLSHDEVVYGKRSLFDRMPGPEWERFANLRLMFGYMFTHPGTKLIFQGGEFGQSAEWNFQESLDWHLLQYDFHTGIQKCVKDLNKLYKSQPALYERQFRPEGFEWIEWADGENSVLSYLRKGYDAESAVLVICNFTPVPRENYKVGVPEAFTKANTKVKELFNSNEKKYGGSGDFISKKVKVEATPWNGREHSITLDLAPLAVMVFGLK
ncbi:MAG TPA: 1,4-alpha-glucan branching enzyme, partial [Leeuwenhoekiella sp.]|nr:1,4-alpha-glucan branching enzyme [Leeuwenhoekiella sp.]